jgi:hypothetical protein
MTDGGCERLWLVRAQRRQRLELSRPPRRARAAEATVVSASFLEHVLGNTLRRRVIGTMRPSVVKTMFRELRINAVKSSVGFIGRAKGAGTGGSVSMRRTWRGA